MPWRVHCIDWFGVPLWPHRARSLLVLLHKSHARISFNCDFTYRDLVNPAEARRIGFHLALVPFASWIRRDSPKGLGRIDNFNALMAAERKQMFAIP